MASDILQGLFQASLAGSIGALLVLALRLPVRRKFGARTAYALWLLVPLMAAASFLPALPAVPALFSGDNLAVEGAIALASPAVPLGGDLDAWLLGAWIAGAMALAIATGVIHWRFTRSLGRASLDASGFPIFRAPANGAGGPAVVGAISPRIVIPADFEARYSPKEQAMVLAHERAHLFAHDAQAVALGVILRCLNWFNPLAHIAARLMRIDQELACDEAVMAQFPGQRRTYAEAMLKTQLAAAGPPFGCQWPAREPHALEQRIQLISRSPARMHRAAGAALAVFLCIAGATFAWAAQPPQLFPGQGRELQVWVAVKADRNLLGPAQPSVVRSGGVASREIRARDGVKYDVRMAPRLLQSGNIAIAAEVKLDGETVARGNLLLQQGEPQVLKVGERYLLFTARVG